MTRLLLVRHGQSEWNADGRWQGQANPPLTELGHHQARTAARSIGAVDAIFSSTLERARDTASAIAAELGVGPVAHIEELQERHAGEWQGMRRSEIDEAYPGYLDGGRRPNGWESDESLGSRAQQALTEICGVWPGGDVLVVTHGGVIYQVEKMLGSAFERISNLGARWINVEAGAMTLGERLDLLSGHDVTVPDQI